MAGLISLTVHLQTDSVRSAFITFLLSLCATMLVVLPSQPKETERRAREMDGRLTRLRAIARTPGAMEAAIYRASVAEGANVDPIEEAGRVRDLRHEP